ncbi:MAG: hypothetical protein M0Q88_01140 [Bacilli bacterium]|nr:hypothetical protein [Bacilli bacterium]
MKNDLKKHVRVERYYELVYRKKGRITETIDRFDNFEAAKVFYEYLTEDDDDIEYDYIVINEVTVEKTTTTKIIIP